MDTHPAFNSYYEKLADGTVRCIDSEIPFDIPDNWAWARMGNIGDWGAGATPAKGNPAYYGGSVLWLRTGELNNSIILDTEIKITEKALKECSLRQNKIGDVLIAMYGATIGKVAIAGVELTTNQACCACTPILLYNKYLFYFLMANQTEFAKKGEGGAQPNISREKLIVHLIPIPPIREQHRIVSQVESLFPYIEKFAVCQKNLNAINDPLNANIKKAILQEAIQGRLVPQIESEGTAEQLLAEIETEKKRLVKEGKLKKSVLTASRIFRGDDNKYYEQIGSQILDITEEIQYDIPDNWRWCRLGDIAMLRLGKTPPRGELIYWKPEKYNWVSISDMRDGEVITQTKEFISEKGAELFQGRISPKGSLLMSFKLTIGKISELGIDAYHNEAIITILPFFNQLVWFKYFLPMIAQSGETKDAIKGKTLNSKSLAALLIPLPPLSEQNRIVAQIETLLECIK